MAEKDFIETNLDDFMTRVEDLRHESEGGKLMPSEIVSRAARNMGLGSAMVELTCAGLRQTVDGEDSTLDDIRFWIMALVGVSSRAGSFEKGWLDKFTEQFLGKVKATRDFPNPCELKLLRETAVRFRTMLQTTIAVSENKEKVGKVAVRKCPGFRAVKYWSEGEGWDPGDGFTEADRVMLRKLVAGGVDKSSASTPCTNGLSEEHKQAENLQRNLNEERNKNGEPDAQLQTARREVEQLKKELAEARTQHEYDQMARGDLEKKQENLQQEIERLREEPRQLQGEYQRQMKEAQQRAAILENRAKTKSDAIASVVSPIRRQIEDSRGKPMSVELGNVLLTHVNRIIDVLKENGLEI